MKVFNPVASGKASGRALGGVFSFNRGMGTFKKYVKPYQKNTVKQQAIKTRFSYLTKFWRTELTYGEITLWNDWNLPWTDIYGDAVSLIGINKFLICNDTLLRAEKTLTRIPPTLTPSELTVENITYGDVLVVGVDGIPNAEIAAQESFLQIQILGTLQDISYITGILQINALGISVSRRPLEKLYSAVYFYDCRIDLDGEIELVNLLKKDEKAPSLQSLRIQRFNKFGYWSAPLTYTDAVIYQTVITNGHFYYDGDWTLTGGSTIHDGILDLVGTGNSRQEGLDITAGKTYRIEFDAVFEPESAVLYFYLGNQLICQIDTSDHYEYETQYLTGVKRVSFNPSGECLCTIDNLIVSEL